MNQYIYTDSLGKFNITGVTVGGWFGYPGMSVSFIKNGYKKVTKKREGHLYTAPQKLDIKNLTFAVH